ncbi:RagB/SusD family nutrient uptake outer membrane protein [Gaoshiqia sp. Z1-71]|uniref:RagB/SusD family nutrient uptake outer membrane protein n=1 Tax=Gaoshiqia hydrogeniformans TaxID=3290090 RepID=UPI003BF7CC5A
MKSHILNMLIGMMLLFLASCSDILDEQPRSVLTPDLFTTKKGIDAGLTAAYDGLRYISGAQASQFSTQYGTDEFTTGEGTPVQSLDMSNGSNPINASTGDVSTFWNNLFPFINTCNGIIEYGTEAGMDESLIAEAYFLRAYYYFQMVRMFGGVPLDLGSGELKFNTSQSNVSRRNTEDEVYTAIIADLKQAETNLPVNPRLPGCAFRATAIHFLAKVYLTHGDYQLALTEAEKLLSPANPYTENSYGIALLTSYAEVIRPTNEHNSEVLFTCEHTNESYEFNETAAGFGSGPTGKDDRSCSYYTPNYPARFKLRNSDAGGVLLRTLEYQRPWMRFTSTHFLRQVIFADKTNDSRYHATFFTAYLNNNVPVTGLLGTPLEVGDTAFVFADNEVSDVYKATKNYRIYNPSEITREIFPGVKKFADPNRKDVNDASGRPFILAKLAETYLIAAEAAMETGDNTKARNYILVLRKRAAKEGREQAMIDTTPATIDINYILDERSRELCGEQHRWFDLKRTGTWRTRAGSYSINGTNNFPRDIKLHYDLRPIPQGQIDLMGNSDAEKAAYQNPGY